MSANRLCLKADLGRTKVKFDVKAGGWRDDYVATPILRVEERLDH